MADSTQDTNTTPQPVAGPSSVPASAPIPASASVPANTSLPLPARNPAANPIEPTLMPQTAGTPSVWKNLAMGALMGAMAGAGQPSFGSGVVAGAGQELGAQRQKDAQAVQQQNLQFQSVKAADSHIAALGQAKLVDLQTEAAREKLQAFRDQTLALDKQLGLPDPRTIEGNGDDIHAQAIGALGVMAASNGGTIPPVVATVSPSGGAQKTFQIDYRTPPSSAELRQNTTIYKALVTQAYMAEGRILTDGTWNAGNTIVDPSSPGKSLVAVRSGQANMVQDAYARLYTPFGGQTLSPGNTPADIAGANKPKIDLLTQQANNYDKLPDANPQVSGILHAQALDFSSAVDNAVNGMLAIQGRVASGVTVAQNSGPALAAKVNAAQAQSRAKTEGQLTGAGDMSLTGDAYRKSLPLNEQSLVTQMGSGQMPPDLMSRYLYKNPGILNEVTRAYPDFDASKIEAYKAVYKDFTSGKVSQALNSGGTVLQHLRELQQLNTPASMTPGLPPYTAYQNKLNTVVGELTQFYKMSSTEYNNRDMQAGLGAKLTANRHAAIMTQVHSMEDKLTSYANQWETAAPSKQYQASMPNISPQARAALAAIDPGFVSANPEFGPRGGVGGVGVGAPVQSASPPGLGQSSGGNDPFTNFGGKSR